MRNWVRLTLVIVSLAAAGVAVWQLLTPSDEPVYKGRTLTSWLKDRDKGPVSTFTSGRTTTYSRDNPETAEAVRQMGTNAIPTLLRLLRAKDSAPKLKILDLLGRVHSRLVEHAGADYWNTAGVFGFKALGTNAQAAVPELVQIARRNISPVSHYSAILSLGYIGPPAKQAVPYLLQGITATNLLLCADAVWAFIRIDPEAAARAGFTNGLVTVSP